MNKFNVIYQTPNGPHTDFEFEYIENIILKNIIHKNHLDNNKYNIKIEDSLIIYSCDKLKPSNELTKYLNELKIYSLLHLSNEYQQHLAGYYKKAKVVLRTASWDISSSYKNVYTLPLGFQSGFYNKNYPEIIENDIEKKYIWSFIGQIKNDRNKMVEALKEIKPNYIYSISNWMSNDIITPSNLIDIYKKTIFIPSPFGNINFECFRTMEALEWGCIPVTTMFLGRDCYKYIYGDHPFIVGSDWQDCANQISILINNPKLLEQKQIQVKTWYNDFRKNLSLDVESILSGRLKDIKGKQFSYQKELNNDLYFKLKFNLKFKIMQNLNKTLRKVISIFNYAK